MLGGNEDSYSSILCQGLQLKSMTYEVKSKHQHYLEVFDVLLQRRKISHGGWINPQLPTECKREKLCEQSKGAGLRQGWDSAAASKCSWVLQTQLPHAKEEEGDL